jgi:hypothetical protein
MRPEALQGGHRSVIVSSAARAVIRAWDALDEDGPRRATRARREASLAEAIEELRAVAGVWVDDDYDPKPYIEAQEWVFARTMPETPHWYVVIRASTDWAEHLRFGDWIRQSGEVETFKGRQYRYRVVDGWRYWVLGPNDTILNRRVEPG